MKPAVLRTGIWTSTSAGGNGGDGRNAEAATADGTLSTTRVSLSLVGAAWGGIGTAAPTNKNCTLVTPPSPTPVMSSCCPPETSPDVGDRLCTAGYGNVRVSPGLPGLGGEVTVAPGISVTGTCTSTSHTKLPATLAIAGVTFVVIKVSDVSVPPACGAMDSEAPALQPFPAWTPAGGARITVPPVSPVPAMATDWSPTTGDVWIERSVTATGTR